MVIAHLISSQGYFGAESMLVALGAECRRRGCTVLVGVFRDARSPHLEVAEAAERCGLPVELVSCAGRWDRRAVRRIQEAFGGGKTDVLHTHGYKADLYGWAAFRARGPALVSTCHNWPDRRWSMRAYAVLDRVVLRRFDFVAAASRPVAERLRRAGVRRVMALPNGVDLERFAGARPTLREQMPDGASKLVGFVGRLSPEKGGEVLLAAARRIVSERDDVAFALVGDGPCRSRWEQEATRLGLADRVLFPGIRRDMPGVYASFDALLLPSWNEAMPMCLLEAMSAGVPVVATRVGSVPDLVVHEETGLLVAPGDAPALAQAVGRLLDQREFADRLAARARARVAERFSLEAMASAYWAAYQQAAARRGGRSRTGSSA